MTASQKTGPGMVWQPRGGGKLAARSVFLGCFSFIHLSPDRSTPSLSSAPPTRPAPPGCSFLNLAANAILPRSRRFWEGILP
jgi:hypothetical protein